MHDHAEQNNVENRGMRCEDRGGKWFEDYRVFISYFYSNVLFSRWLTLRKLIEFKLFVLSNICINGWKRINGLSSIYLFIIIYFYFKTDRDVGFITYIAAGLLTFKHTFMPLLNDGLDINPINSHTLTHTHSQKPYWRHPSDIHQSVCH